MEETAAPAGTGQTPLTRALATIRTLRRRIEEQESSGPIAVIGVGLRLPGGIDGLDGYWEALTAGRDLVRPVPAHRKEPFAAEWDTLPQRGGFLDDVLGFDAAFFGISPREARHLDPQQRMLLEVAWEAMENAGLPAGKLSGTQTGMYLGIMWQDYRDWLAGAPDAYWTTGNGHNFAAGRVAHALGLNGPAMAVDTACSSSLVAVHLAAQALRRGDCEVAFAAGTNLILSPRSMRLVQETRSLAPDGLCKAFDARANGFVRGEGCGVVVLKRLDHALRDGDRVHGVIHGTAVNQDGRSGGFTAPNVLSQVALIERALADAGLEPADIGYVEAHGTGTSLGDPIEMEALATALGRVNGGAPLAVGAAKSNFGHLEATAGVAGLVKAMLCVGHRQAPPVVHFRTLNPRIDLSGTAITVPDTLTDLPRNAGRHAGVSSFGMSGTNAHIVLGPPGEGTPRDEPAPAVAGFEISAKTPEALRALAGRYAEHLAGLAPASYAAFAYSAGEGRTAHEFRARIASTAPEDAVRALRALAAGGPLRSPADASPLPALPRAVIDLPSYPWERLRFAPETLPGPAVPTGGASRSAAAAVSTAAPAAGSDGVAGAPAGAAPAASPAPGGSSAASPAPDGGLPVAHVTRWVAAPQGDATPGADAGDALVLAGDDPELLTELLREAAARGVRGTLLTPVPPGTAADGWITAGLPEGPDAWRRFWAERSGDAPTALVLALRGAPLPEDPDAADAGRAVTDGAALASAVTAAAVAAGDRCRVHAVTRAAVRTADGDRAAATAHGLLHGLGPVLGLELGSAWGGVVDLPAEPGPGDTRALLGFVLARPAAPGTEDVAAVRDGRILVPRLTGVAEEPADLTVRADATYLVTGGLGAVGRELVADLVRRGARNLLLIGRRAEDELAPEAAGFLASLRRDTDRVVYRGGGCDTPDALTRARAALDGMPPVRGVLHAAGTVSYTPAALTGAEEFADALGGKAAGAWWLHLASRDWPLDFFVLVSSVSAVWGTQDCAAYSAANGALDLLAAHRVSLGLPAVSIAYGPWALGDDGMADAGLRDRAARMGIGTLDAARGRAALTGRAPGADGRLVACPLDMARLRQVMTGLRPRGLFAPDAAPAGDRAGQDGAGAAGGPFADLTPAERPAAARARVRELLADQLGHADAAAVRDDVGFFDLGLDSIMAVDLTVRLSAEFGTSVQVPDVFDHPTVTELAAFLLAAPAAAPATTPAPAPSCPARSPAGAASGANSPRGRS
ncbi:beta-ketoacyl synthase N-terminal-like domain-containing protein, partial [Streptomyces sp. t39]|uniref:beta-ketoacyl synthase N-terminal-like domain-containing protein n=1 Tax=Streptomyces sp. t39 TaxID=1828156 RepID=UPI0011CE5104